jgi:hypothetical protein
MFLAMIINVISVYYGATVHMMVLVTCPCNMIDWLEERANTLGHFAECCH